MQAAIIVLTHCFCWGFREAEYPSSLSCFDQGSREEEVFSDPRLTRLKSGYVFSVVG